MPPSPKHPRKSPSRTSPLLPNTNQGADVCDGCFRRGQVSGVRSVRSQPRSRGLITLIRRWLRAALCGFDCVQSASNSRRYSLRAAAIRHLSLFITKLFTMVRLLQQALAAPTTSAVQVEQSIRCVCLSVLRTTFRTK